MSKYLLFGLLLLGLLAAAGTANAAWPNWNTITATFPCNVKVTQTSGGWDYQVSVDPKNEYPGYGIKAFAVYASDLTTEKSNGWKSYNGGNTMGWGTDGGWERNKYPGPKKTTAAFGWTGCYDLYGGHSAVFHAVSLPSGFANWDQHFAVWVQPASKGYSTRCDNSFWAKAQEEPGRPPEETPEPGSLALLTLGGGAVFGAIKRRKS